MKEKKFKYPVLKDFYEKIQFISGINLENRIAHSDREEQGRRYESIFIYAAQGKNDPEQEFIIDIEIDLHTKTAVLYHIALPLNIRHQGMGTGIVAEIEKMMRSLGLRYISLPAEHHSTGFWLKSGYRFKHAHEHQFYNANKHRENLHIAYELEKILK